MNTDAVVIGGGIAGLATAHRLLQLGMTVTILERGRCGREASWAGAGILSPLLPWNYAEAVTCLTQLSNKLYPGFIETLRQQTGIDPEYQASGMLVLPGSSMLSHERDDDPYERMGNAEAWCADHAFPLQRVRSHDIAPALARDESALWLPETCQVRNPRLLQALIASIAHPGGMIIENAEVTDWKMEHGQVRSVRTSRGDEFSAGCYIVTAGAWSRHLLQEYGSKLEIRPVRGQILLFKLPPGMLSTIVLQEQEDFYLIPRRDGHILAGSTVEEAGFNRETTSQARETLLAKAHALLPALTEETLAGHWAGLRPGSPDNIPVMDHHPDIGNLYLNSGHYRYGVTMAPASALILGSMILGQPQPLDTKPYRWPA
ncbi:MAG TPA: glycine oxidase ThiO [Nitrosospira sp.]|nr:glycine oxidase ThiO [Nitrosospira sp.]